MRRRTDKVELRRVGDIGAYKGDILRAQGHVQSVCAIQLMGSAVGDDLACATDVEDAEFAPIQKSGRANLFV